MRSFLSILFASMVMLVVTSSQAMQSDAADIQRDSLSKPQFSDPALNRSIDELTAQLDQFFQLATDSIDNGMPGMREELLRLQQEIFLQSEMLSDEELQQIFTYIESYAAHLETKIDQHFQALIDAAQEELEMLKKEQEELTKPEEISE